MDENSFEKKPKKKIGVIISIIVVLLLIAAVVAGVVYLNLTRKPEKIFEKAIEDAFEMNEKEKIKSGRIELELSAKIDSEETEIQQVNSILSLVKLNATTEMDLEKKIFNQNLTASVMGEQIVSVDALIQNEKIYMYLKDIYSKYIQIDEEYLEGIDLATMFAAEAKTADEKLEKDIKQILLDEVTSRELTQEKVELDGKNVTKTTLRLTPEEVLEITNKILNKVYEYQPNTELRDAIEVLQDEIEDLEDNENYADISIYTEGLKNDIVKVDMVLVNVEDEEVIIIEMNKPEKDVYEISFLLNEESTSVSKAQEIIKITVEEESENKGKVTISVEAEGTKVTLNVKYNVEYNVNIEERNTSNSIKANSLTEKDFEEMYENMQENEILNSIMQSMLTTEDLFGEIE